MNKYVSRGLWTVLVTGGFMALGVGVAHADTGTSGDDGIASGTQGILGIEVPVQLGGNAISLLGDADSSGASTSAPAADASSGSTGSTSGSDSVAGGTQLLPELGVPITLGGNSISLLGDASSSGSTTAASGSDDAGAPSGATDGTDGTLSGTQVLGDVGLPVTLGGNAISVLGDASSSDAGTASGSADAGDQEGSTSGTDGVLGGSQVLADAGVPVTLGGNAISLLGDASTSDAGVTPGESGGTAGDTGGTTDGADGTLSGTQLLGDVGAPVTLGGNAISVLGDASSEGAGTASGSTAGGQEGSTGGTDGTLGGTQLLADLGIPVTLGGNAVSLLGDASTGGSTTDVVDPGTDPGTDPGDDSGTDPGDGSELPTYALAAGDVTALAATGVEGGLTALGLAVLLLAVGGVMVRQMAVRRR